MSEGNALEARWAEQHTDYRTGVSHVSYEPEDQKTACNLYTIMNLY
jgi:hypothetical protein